MRIVIVLGALALATPLAAQSLADRILAPKNGTVRLTYASRDGLCGDGETFIRDLSRGDDHYIVFGSVNEKGWRRRIPCEEGPARVAISLFDGGIRKVRVYIGGAWRETGASDVHDLGVVSAARAAEAFLTLAARDRRGEEMLFAATVADSVTIWPDLLRLARNENVPRASRRSAVFWISQVAEEAATRGLTEIVDDSKGDREVREQAVFALSQLPEEQGIPALIRVARTNPDPGLRRKAIFWLAQSEDPRALSLFEEILSKGR
ncbi:MAG: HEAT repeat domain-containing protein [Gemmatimonadales bacterium]